MTLGAFQLHRARTLPKGHLNSQPASKDSDWVFGAKAIAEHVFGDRAKARRVYYLMKEKRLPVMKVGSLLSSTRSALNYYLFRTISTYSIFPDFKAPPDALKNVPKLLKAVIVDGMLRLEFVGTRKSNKRILPDKPRRLWKRRAGGRRTKEDQAKEDGEIIAFLRDVYGPYFRDHRRSLYAYIRRNDRPLFNVIQRLKRANKLPSELYLPSRDENIRSPQ